MMFFFFFKQKTAYEMRISDWSSDVCSSDLARDVEPAPAALGVVPALEQQALRVVAQEDELRPFGVGEAGRVLRPLDVRLAAAMEFGQIGRASCRASVCQYV